MIGVIIPRQQLLNQLFIRESSIDWNVPARAGLDNAFYALVPWCTVEINIRSVESGSIFLQGKVNGVCASVAVSKNVLPAQNTQVLEFGRYPLTSMGN